MLFNKTYINLQILHAPRAIIFQPWPAAWVKYNINQENSEFFGSYILLFECQSMQYLYNVGQCHLLEHSI